MQEPSKLLNHIPSAVATESRNNSESLFITHSRAHQAHKHPIPQNSPKTPFQSKYMHGHLRQNQFCTHSDLNLYKYYLTQKSDHQHNNISQFHKFKFRALSVKFQILSKGFVGLTRSCSSCSRVRKQGLKLHYRWVLRIV
jgi:hypothetical protein